MLLGAVQSPEQAELAPRLDAAVAAVVGYIDYTVDSVAVRVVGGDALRIAEAVRRRRVETGPDDLFVERGAVPALARQFDEIRACYPDVELQENLTEGLGEPETPSPERRRWLWDNRIGCGGGSFRPSPTTPSSISSSSKKSET